MKYRAIAFEINLRGDGCVFEVGSLFEALCGLQDQRDRRGVRYALVTVLVFVVLAKLAGENHLRGIAQWVQLRAQRLADFLGLERAQAPHATTYSRILGQAVQIDEFERVVGQFFGQPASAERGVLIALDGKMLIDDNALYRQATLAEMRDLDVEAPSEIEARRYGLSFIKLDGSIGCMVNGAGLAMTTMDITKLFGGSPANFLDIGGGASSEKVAAALRIILADASVKAVLFNIFGGITRCDEVARGILTALKEVKPNVPMVIRLVGTNAEEGRRMLADAKMITADTLAEAAQKAVAVAKGG